jgi:hypothetical protein
VKKSGALSKFKSNLAAIEFKSTREEKLVIGESAGIAMALTTEGAITKSDDNTIRDIFRISMLVLLEFGLSFPWTCAEFV